MVLEWSFDDQGGQLEGKMFGERYRQYYII